MSVKQPTWFGPEGQIVLREAWEETHRLHPEATAHRAKIIWGIDGSDSNKCCLRGIDFQIHPDLSVTCSEGYRPVVKEGILLGFEKEEK